MSRLRSVLLIFLLLFQALSYTTPAHVLQWKLKLIANEFPALNLLTLGLIWTLPPWNKGYTKAQLGISLAIGVLVCTPIILALNSTVKSTQNINLELNKADILRSVFSLPFGSRSIRPDTAHYISQGQRQSVLVYKASTTIKAFIIGVHGGGWDAGNASEMNFFDETLAQEGFLIASVNYSLAPKYPFPRASADVQEAIKQLCAQFNPNHSVPNIILGRSAGAQIALSSTLAQKESIIDGMISLYGPSDLIWAYNHSSNTDIIGSKKLLEQYLGPFKNRNSHYQQASPVYSTSPHLPPLLLIHGKADNLVSPYHSLKLFEKYLQTRHTAFLLEPSWATHGADYHPQGPFGQLSLQAILAFSEFIKSSKIAPTNVKSW